MDQVIAGVEPQFTVYDGADADGYALAVNIARRHLTTGSRAMIAAKAAHLLGYGGQKKLAADTGISNLRISDASMVLTWCDTATVNNVLAGDTPLSKALELARQLKQEDADREAKKSRLRKGAPDLLARVGEEVLSLDDAIAALDAWEEKGDWNAACREEAGRVGA